MRKKITMLFASLLACVGVMKAQTWLQPTVSTESETYEYYIMNYRNQAYYVTTTKGLDGGAQQLGSANEFTDTKAKVTFKLTEGGKLYSTNTTESLILGYTTTDAVAKSVQLFAADSEEGYTWKIEAANDGYTLSAGTSDNSWNMHGGAGADIGLYGKTDGGSNWVFVPANEAAIAKANEAKALYAPSAEYYYQIKNVAYSRMLAANATNAISISTNSTADLNQLWAFEEGENGTFYLRNAGQQKYLVASTASNTAWTVGAEGTAFEVEMLNLEKKNWTLHAYGQDKFGCAHDANWGWDAQVVRWEAVAQASQWYLERTDVSTTAQEISFVYSFTYNGDEKFTQSCVGIVGEDYPEITISFPASVSAAKPTGKLTAQEANQKISIELTVSELPFFKYADSYAAIQDWYYLPMHANNRYYMSYAADQENIPLGNEQKVLPLLSGNNHDAYLWAFVGNPVDGFMVVNKAAGDGYVLSSATTITDEANTFPLMTALSAINTDTHNTYWYPTSSGNYGNNGFYLAQKGFPSHKMNVRSNKLAYWTGGADAGSTFQVTTLATDEDFAMVDLLKADAGKVGYPKNADALNALALNQSTKLDMNVAVKNYKTNSNIVLPVDGKAYRIANYSLYNDGTTRYLNYTANAALSVSEDVNSASVFVCREIGAGVYVLVAEDGKVLTWPHSAEGYKEGDKWLGYSNFYATTYSNYSDWNKITIKKNGSAEVDYGHLRLVARRYGRDDNPNSSFIINGKTGAWDRAGDAYFLQAASTNQNCFSSAWTLTEVEHTNNDAQQLALARIDAKTTFGNRTLGEGIGKYHCVVNGEDVYTVNVDEMETAEEVNAVAATIAINQPAAGFYRIKSMNANYAEMNGNYLQVKSDASGLEYAKSESGDEPGNKATSVFYICDNTILSYTCGQYLNSALAAPAAAGTEAVSWVIKENAEVTGTYALEYEKNDSDNGYLSDWLSYPTNGRNDANAAWIFEEVTWLPVAMNTTVGWATFYSPVQLELSSDRVKAYTGVVDGSVVKLDEQSVVPANTGVILELQQDAEVEDGYVFLEISKSETVAVEDNDLSGTFADTYVAEAAYVLANGSKGVGLYKAALNQQDGTSFLNQGFKAYLPASAKTAGAPMFSFDRGEGTTAIDNSQLTIDNSAIIYDLAGRRVEKMEKGIYIVNGRKVIR